MRIRETAAFRVYINKTFRIWIGVKIFSSQNLHKTVLNVVNITCDLYHLQLRNTQYGIYSDQKPVHIKMNALGCILWIYTSDNFLYLSEAWQPLLHLRKEKTVWTLFKMSPFVSLMVETTWGWINNDRTVIFRWTIPLKKRKSCKIAWHFTTLTSILIERKLGFLAC